MNVSTNGCIISWLRRGAGQRGLLKESRSARLCGHRTALDDRVGARPAGQHVTASLTNAVNATAVAERPAPAAPASIDTTKTPKQLGFTMPGAAL